MPKSGRIVNKRVSNERKGNYYDGKKDVSKLGAGDSFYISNFIKGRRECDKIFTQLLNEVDFVQMFYFKSDSSEVEPIPRMVGGQTCKTSDSSAIYRMPGCNQSNINTQNWTPTVKEICNKASEEVGQQLNHCICTLYRDENDSLAYHTDKLLDLDENSNVLSVSFGAARPMLFQEINGKNHQRIMLQPGSLIAIGPKTNRRYKHSIPKVENECGPRISLSIRTVKTFVTEKGKVSGQGERYQDVNYPFITSNDDTSQYSEEVKEEMEKYTKREEDRLTLLRGIFGRTVTV